MTSSWPPLPPSPFASNPAGTSPPEQVQVRETGGEASLRVFVGVHRSVVFPPRTLADFSGPVIDAATRLRFPDDAWEFPAGPSTHALVVVAARDDLVRRLDAQPPRAEWTWYVTPPPWPTLLWEIEDDTASASRRAESLAGSPYDVAELLNQGAWPLQRAGVRVRYAGDDAAWICTTLACEVMRAAGGRVAQLADRVAQGDCYPHELARALTRAEGWCCRSVDPVTLEPRI